MIQFKWNVAIKFVGEFGAKQRDIIILKTKIINLESLIVDYIGFRNNEILV